MAHAGNGHAGNGHDAAETLSELGLVAEATAGYVALNVDLGSSNGGGAPAPWAGIADEYIEQLHQLIARVDRAAIVRFVEVLREARDRGATIFLAGNGGSSATAAHWVNDLGKATKRSGRTPLRVMNLTDNVPWITALGNDEGIEHVFSGQLENFAQPKDIVIVISASGNSPNILHLLTTARAAGLTSIGLVGFDGGRALGLLDEALLVETEPGEYGLVESAHSALADIITTCLIKDRVPVSVVAD